MENKKKFYEIPFSAAFVTVIRLSVYGVYIGLLYLLYRQINMHIHFEIKWFVFIGILGLLLMIPVQNILEKALEKITCAEITIIFDSLKTLTLIVGLACVTIPCLLIGIPGNIVALIFKVTGHTAAKKTQEEKEKEKEKQYQEETERINRMAWEARQYYEEAEREEARQRAIQQIQDYAKSLGFSHIPSMEEFKHARNAYLKKHHPDNGGTSEEFIQAKKDMENMEEIVKLWHAGHLYDDAESEETYDK